MAFNLQNHIFSTAVPRSIARGGLTIDVTFPDGTEQADISAIVLYDTEQVDPETGNLISVKNTYVVIAQADLDQEIGQDDIVYFRIPKNPGSDVQVSVMFDGSKSFIDGDTLGFLRIPVTEVEQA